MKRVVFMGSSEFAVPSLKALVKSSYEVALVVTREDKPKGRGLKVSQTPVKEFAVQTGLRVFQPKTLKNEEAQNVVKSVAPDVIVVAAYGRILPKEVLEIPPRLPSGHYGCLNLHGSLLPKFRGAAPVQWAIIKGEKEAGVTLMAMDEGLDTGPILAQEKVIISEEDTSESLLLKLAEVAASVLMKNLEGVLKGEVKPVPQDETLASFAPIINKEDGVIEWEQDAEAIERFVRGMFPWPCAYTFLQDGQMLKILPKAFVVEEEFVCEHKKAGKVLRIDDEGMLVRCGRGALLVKTVQKEGKKAMTPKELLIGRQIRADEVFQKK
jgi:methionyl-tRNA formyltransferase